MKNHTKVASNYVYKENKKYWLNITLLLPKRRRESALFLCAYLIMVDNAIDGKELTIIEKKKFVSDQLKLIDLLIHGEKPFPIHREQKYLLEFYNYCLAIGKKNYIYDVKTIVESLKWDVGRLENEGIFSEKDLTKYMDNLLKSTFRVFVNLLLPDKKEYYNNDYISEFFWHLANARDFKEDLEAGYINISKEDIQKYNLDLHNLCEDKNLRIWFESILSHLWQLLESEARILSKMYFRIKLIWFAAYTFYLPQLLRLQLYGHNCGNKYEKKIIKEINVYFSSLICTLKQFHRIFFIRYEN